jgi:hypothetical protein
MKSIKTVVLICYYLAVIIVLKQVFNPSIELVLMSGLLGFLKIPCQLLLGIDQAEKKDVIIFKVVVLIVITGLSSLMPICTLQPGYTHSLGESAPGISMLFWTLFLFMIGLDVYIIYCYLFEKKETSLI